MESATVLLVEDDDSLRGALARLLCASGFRCEAFASAEALLARGGAEGAACVVTDLRLPAMSGLELLVELQRRGGWPPLVLITAHDAPGLREDVLRRGAADYLVKPFPGAALLATLRSVMATAGSA